MIGSSYLSANLKRTTRRCFLAQPKIFGWLRKSRSELLAKPFFTICCCISSFGMISVSGCSYTPVTDLRASGDKAQFVQRDLMECESLARQVDFAWSPYNRRIINKCLEGRGHSVLSAF